MNPEALAKILEALAAADVREFSLETGEYKLAVKRGAEVVTIAAPAVTVAPPASAPVAASAPAASAPQVEAPASTPEPAAPAKTAGTPVKAPIVGTFYSAPSPDNPPYVKVGDRVEVGQVLCIIEAMKLMNEIESDVAGIVREVLVKNAEPVEYGQTLFVIE
ncbi:acetyl-CoA carboxylase biotin carboxyl carrier protein [Deinococcus yavapaiensis]|uniref:Biotin carboxyl carrier protein of acetyl-CoA carboxylase n=1 Tax=Deinococcus yavapaiensis KR-236 TaxID=694435 RepID=A0A318SEW6_9DEIO|nr:acetyl-CoA carboxylase biotin carboxyl carrier protein [Deinococcus yavapaiensis]PYE55222.1 biotin carboxyl carrier protein [Deinococcus yavapaiensis KR-236]